jgi:hypothetical protein
MDFKTRCRYLHDIGCLACRKFGYCQPPDIHHLLSGHVKRGNQFTISLCPYHHRGVWNDRFANLRYACTLLGPSLALEPNRFREVFGSDEELLKEANQLIAMHKRRKV